MNPILSKQYFIPDAEAHQWKDGRMYIYGSYDVTGNSFYCSHEYHVFSSEDLVQWKDHGQSFSSIGGGDSSWNGKLLFAPDCIYHNGKYYLYFCYCTGGVCEAVATSVNPYGPFKDAVTVKGPNLDQIDPAIFADDDGSAYLYWGQFKAIGARLKDSMTEIDADSICLDLINEEKHGFHEGSSMRKRNGIYYLVYADISRGKPTCLSYATSISPLGPFEKGGVIIDNIGCDPESWNNHGSISEFNGKWYVFYHRSSQNSKFSRRVCVEPITFNEDGSINEVEMTTQGVSSPIDPLLTMEAYRACLVSGESYVDADEVGEYFKAVKSGDWAAYKYFDFKDTVRSFEITAASFCYQGLVEIRLDSPKGQLIGKIIIDYTGGWKKWQQFSCNVEQVSGIHAIYLVCYSAYGRPFNIRDFRFKR